MIKDLVKIGIRYNAVYIDTEKITLQKEINSTTANLLTNLSKIGYVVDEPLLHALNGITPIEKSKIYDSFVDVLHIKNNWMPLVKEWNIPTGETHSDHFFTFLENVFKSNKVNGVTLPCGHLIPSHTFPLEKYNGCPYCGMPFKTGTVENMGQGSNKKVLSLWSDKEMKDLLSDLLTSKTALDATQVDTLKILLKNFQLPKVDIGIKESLMLVVDILIETNQEKQISYILTTPADILRYLWYKKTGFLQIVEPKTIIKRNALNNTHIFKPLDQKNITSILTKDSLKLKYSRTECKRVAEWLNALNLNTEKICEMMHPKRGMWIRFIRALRLAEYSKKVGFEKLKDILDVFYNEVYEVWNERVNYFRLKADAENTFALLKQRPGLFARSLFSNMLWFGPEKTISAFSEIIDQLPARLIFTLNMYAQNYFIPTNTTRTVKPLGGTAKKVPNHPLLTLYSKEDLSRMKEMIEDLCFTVMEKRFSGIDNPNKTIYIEQGLFNIPISIGDRSDTIHDLPSALQGTRFPIEGDTVRLFMQWGKDLPAQHLDMDLSCLITFDDRVERCSYSQLTATGTQHSGDIRSIPNKVGTAEYINIDIEQLALAHARYVTFTCNAYSNGGISPNMVVGWMNSKYPMKISERTGTAYDPSCVQHQVRITQKLTKGLVFGVLNVKNKEIIWMEMPFDGQVVQQLDKANVENILTRLNSKLNVGDLLLCKAKAQNLSLVDKPELADEAYTLKWVMNTAEVTKVILPSNEYRV